MNTNLESLNDMVGRLTEMAKKPVDRICQHCGDNEDVAPQYFYKSETTHYFCKDAHACWRRWDEQHGIDMKELTK